MSKAGNNSNANHTAAKQNHHTQASHEAESQKQHRNTNRLTQGSLTFPLSCLVAGSWRAVKATDPGSILQDEGAAANASRVWQLQRLVREALSFGQKAKGDRRSDFSKQVKMSKAGNNSNANHTAAKQNHHTQASHEAESQKQHRNTNRLTQGSLTLDYVALRRENGPPRMLVLSLRSDWMSRFFGVFTDLLLILGMLRRILGA